MGKGNTEPLKVDSLQESPQASLSVLILTRNEEANIAACLASVAWAKEVRVIDSLSSDSTVEIAQSLGAKVYSHPFEGYAKQRNWALDNLPISSEWVLFLDADEQIPAPLAEQIRRVVSSPGNHYAGYYLNRRFYLLGRWLRHGGLSPNWILRLFRRQAGRCENREVNEHIVVTGPVGRLDEPFDHRDNRGLSEWIAKHNRYAALEAEIFLRQKSEERREESITPRLRGQQPERRRWLKLRLWDRLPLLARPFLHFLYNYFLRGGFLDATPGFVYHVLWSFWYRFLVDVKILEMRRRVGVGVFGPDRDDRARVKLCNTRQEPY
jgi:glycosyltransferase involved in cell wall biosynthesis